MRNISILLALILFTSCHWHMNETVEGNGRLTTEQRNTANITKVKIQGGIDVELQQGNSSVKVEADENLQRYIIAKEEDGWLVIKTKDQVNLRSEHHIKVYVSADMIDAIKILGSGNVTAKGKFSGANKLDIDIAGSGEVDIEVNTPKVMVDIAGSGNVRLSGETRDASIKVRGSGNYNGESLMTENTDVSIMGSGNATVHADATLDADVKGSGNIYYRGKAAVTKHKAGSGSIEHIE